MDRPRVLVVEPEAQSQTLIRRVLGKHCDLLLQTDPLRMFEAIELFEPDLLIMELALPGLSGFEMLHLLGNESGCPALPIMIFSATHDVDSQKLAYRLGARHFQAKPCPPSRLFKAAAMFARVALANCNRLPKKHSVDEIEYKLVQSGAEHPLHPLIEAALAHHGHALHGAPGRSVLATIAAKRPAGS